MVLEFPGNPEPLAQMGRERLNTERFRRVMPRVDHVEPQLHRIEVGVVGALTGKVGVQACRVGRADPAARATADYADAMAERWAARQQPRPSVEELVDALDQGLARKWWLQSSLNAKRDATVEIERLRRAKLERLSEPGIVADYGVDVERDVRGVERDVSREERPQPTVAPPRDREIAVPQEPVMHQE